MNALAIRGEQRAARRRRLRVLTLRRLARQLESSPLAQASISSTTRMPADS